MVSAVVWFPSFFDISRQTTTHKVDVPDIAVFEIRSGVHDEVHRARWPLAWELDGSYRVGNIVRLQLRSRSCVLFG